jgi:Mrp family chromosome partitioning ATPase
MADAIVLAPYSDVVVLLARWRKTPRKAVQAALRSLNLVHAFVPGVALTRVDMRKQAEHGYGDPAYYYKSVEKYYRA